MESYFTKYDIENIQKQMTMLLAFSILLLSASYIYFINSSVMNAVAREQDDRQIAELTGAVSRLENSYMDVKSGLNIDKAYALGFKDDYSKVHFSSERPNVAGNLSLLGNEI